MASPMNTPRNNYAPGRFSDSVEIEIHRFEEGNRSRINIIITVQWLKIK